MTVDVSLLERDMKAIIARRGPGVIHPGDQQVPVSRIALPSPGLMRITSGGVPMGRMMRMWGEPSSGKSLILWMIFCAAQQMRTERYPFGLNCCYYNIEKQYDPIFTAARGVDVASMQLVEETVIEYVAQTMAGENAADRGLLNSIHVHGIDSCSTAVPIDRLARDSMDWDRGLDAKAWMRALYFIHEKMDKDDNVIIYLDHEIRDFDTQRRKAPGGKAMEHASSLTLHFTCGRWLYYDHEGLLQPEDKIAKDKMPQRMNPATGKKEAVLGMAGQKEADGREIYVKVVKSRVCRQDRRAVMRLDLHSFEFDPVYEMLEGGLYFDIQGGVASHSGQPAIITTASSWYRLDHFGKTAQGDREVRKLIASDPEIQQVILQAMYAGN